jgi:Mrp family chromosome partitioning ATPase
MVGAALGVACAFAWDRLSGRLRGVDDLEDQTGLPVLATVPVMNRGAPDHIAVLDADPRRGAQAFGYLAAHLLHELETSKTHVLIVTSPTAGAGKTTVAMNLSAWFAAAGRPTVLISAELESPTAHEYFRVERKPGLEDVVTGGTSLPDALHATSVPGLRLATCGSSSAGGASILNAEDLKPLLDQLSTGKCVVVIDAPSMLGRPETALLADTADVVLLVVDIRYGKRADAAAAISQLAHVSDRMIGTLANDPGRYGERRSPETPTGSPSPAES